MSGLKWEALSRHRPPEVGALVRWRDVRRGPWQYGYYRGVGGLAWTFSLTADGPIWRHSLAFGLDGQVAVAVPVRHNTGDNPA